MLPLSIFKTNILLRNKSFCESGAYMTTQLPSARLIINLPAIMNIRNYKFTHCRSQLYCSVFVLFRWKPHQYITTNIFSKNLTNSNYKSSFTECFRDLAKSSRNAEFKFRKFIKSSSQLHKINYMRAYNKQSLRCSERIERWCF